MNAFAKNLTMFLGGIFVVGLTACLGTLLVSYKPWGVPDVLREQYDQKITTIHARNKLITEWESRPRPDLAIRAQYDVGLRDPGSSENYSFEIRNDGQLDLNIREAKISGEASLVFSDETIAPGKKSEVTLSWPTQRTEGPFELNATLFTNDPLLQQVDVKFVGEIRSGLIVPDSVPLRPADIAETVDGTFVVSSQLWDDLTVVDVNCDREIFDWHAEPLTLSDSETKLRSAWRVTVLTASTEYGNFASTVDVKVRSGDGETIAKQLTLQGRVNSPVSFYGPEIHKSDGLDIGTVTSGRRRDFHVTVRLKGDVSRQVDVTGLQPACLQAALAPQATPGNYRLTITVPEDCPMAVFNLGTKRGYVEVGDPRDKTFSNWLPLYGVVVPNEK